MTVTQAIQNRHSCRNYAKKEVSNETIKELLTLANQAPSAHNWQNREFIVVKEEEQKAKVLQAYGQRGFENASCLIAVVAEMKDPNDSVDHRHDVVFPLHDTGAAIENLLLAATEKELATCWLGIYNNEQINELLNIPKNRKVVAVIALGYEAEEPESRSDRKPVSEITHYEKYKHR